MKERMSPLGHKPGELYIPEGNSKNGQQIGFIWEGDVYRPATHQELLVAVQQAEAEKHPLINRLSRRRIRQMKAQSDVRYLGQPRTRY